MSIQTVRAAISAQKCRSAWDRGVLEYAKELADSLAQSIQWHGYAPNRAESREWLLDGALDWQQYSEGGCALCYDRDIAARLCSPSEFRRTRGGERRPNGQETWLDVQSRALYQAANFVISAYWADSEG